MHVRAYNHWCELLDGRTFPAVDDLDVENLEDFANHGVLFELAEDPGDPRITFLGRALRAESEGTGGIRKVSDVPARSILSRLSDHYMQIVANRAPVGFEAEFVNTSDAYTLYRGILMPLSSTGETIDAICGVINWKEATEGALAETEGRPVPPAHAVDAEGPGPVDAALAALPEELEESDEVEDVAPVVAADAGLGDRLSAARDCAEHARGSAERSHAALYRALGLAYDFALAAEADPEGFAELLDDAGLKVQARAPMTAVAKLFGAGHDRTRLTEFAAALSWAKREGLAEGRLAGALESSPAASRASSGPCAKRGAPRRAPTRTGAGPAARRRCRPRRGRGRGRGRGRAEFVLLIAARARRPRRRGPGRRRRAHRAGDPQDGARAAAPPHRPVGAAPGRRVTPAPCRDAEAGGEPAALRGPPSRCPALTRLPTAVLRVRRRLMEDKVPCQPLHHASHGPPPRTGEELWLRSRLPHPSRDDRVDARRDLQYTRTEAERSGRCSPCSSA